MSKPDWTTIKSEYVEGSLTLAEVQARHNVPRGTLSARATRERWHDQKQQFAANVEQLRRSRVMQQRAEQQERFESNIIAVASAQLALIARQLQAGQVTSTEVLKLANALEKVQRVGSAAFG